MILIINTTNEKYLEVILAENKDDFKIKKIEGDRKQSEQLLQTIDAILKDNNMEIKDIEGISVVNGPGGFTALRIGVVTANILSYALNIPVLGITLNEFNNNEELVEKSIDKLSRAKAGEIVIPVYGREPNIS